MKKWLETSFIISLVLFLLAGSLLVIGQIAGILLQNGDLITKSHEIFSKPAFLLSAVAGVISYLLKQTKKQKMSAESSEA